MGAFLVFIWKLLSCGGVCFGEEEIIEPFLPSSISSCNTRSVNDGPNKSRWSSASDTKKGKVHYDYFDSSKWTQYEQLAVKPSTSLHPRNANAVGIPSNQILGSNKNGHHSAETDSSRNLLGSQKTLLVTQKRTPAVDVKPKEVKLLVAKEKPSRKNHLISSTQQSQNRVSCLGNGSANDALRRDALSAYYLSELLAGLEELESRYHQGNDGSQLHKKLSANSTKESKTVERSIQGYCSSHKILLVGEGDFSFSACLAKAFGSATNMVATSLNSEAYLKKNYKDAMNNILELRTRGCKVFHEVDATAIMSIKNVTSLSFDRIIYNFPHCGDFGSKGDAIRNNQRLVRWFMKNSAKLVKEDGEIHIRHKSNHFYQSWNLRLLASQAGLVLIDEAPFDVSLFSGYNTKYGFEGGRFSSDYNFDCHSSCTYKFVLRK